jgi:4-hydroxybenzoate polyprenyltransferase
LKRKQNFNKMSVTSLAFRSLWIGLCALSMLAQTRLLLGLSLAPGWLDGFVLGGAVFAYNFTYRDRLRKTAAWLAAACGGFCFFVPIISFSIVAWQLAALLPLVLWLCYYGWQKPGNAGLRGNPVAKPVAVALAWAWVTVMLPLPPERWGEAGFIFFGRATFIFALALAYDLVDLEYDSRHGLATLAGKFGFSTTFLLINGALAAAALCCLANFSLKIYGLHLAIGLLASLALSAWQLPFLLKKTEWSDWQKVWIDALMVGQFLMLWGMKSLS